jgi:hypothetical protein
LANFKLVGTIPVESEALNMVSSGCDTTFIINFKITTGILKGPVALEQFRLAISSSISPAESSWDVED